MPVTFVLFCFALLLEVAPGSTSTGGEESSRKAANTDCVSEQVTAVGNRGSVLLGTSETQERTRSWRAYLSTPVYH